MIGAKRRTTPRYDPIAKFWAIYMKTYEIPAVDYC